MELMKIYPIGSIVPIFENRKKYFITPHPTVVHTSHTEMKQRNTMALKDTASYTVDTGHRNILYRTQEQINVQDTGQDTEIYRKQHK